ncbi:MAG TPA: MBL fold metallo-hydrolase, partial [Caulobacteraceae bacterium]|nr:MBL fold metallo-hydrolase [Caulobacteraceae bacterium]
MRAERVAVPMPFYVIEHERGVALFDCGLPIALTNPADPFRIALCSQDLDVSFESGESTTGRLEALDIDVGDVRWVILSHLHFDHA